MHEPESLITILVLAGSDPEPLKGCLEKLGQIFHHDPHEVLIYSADSATLAAVQALKPQAMARRILAVPAAAGGQSLRAAMNAALGDVVIVTDAELSDPPELMPAMVRKIRVSGRDLVAGSRFMAGGSLEGLSWLQKTATRLTARLLRLLLRVPTSDPAHHFRAYRHSMLLSLPQEDSATGRHEAGMAVELLIKAHLLGFGIEEIPSAWQKQRQSSVCQPRFAAINPVLYAAVRLTQGKWATALVWVSLLLLLLGAAMWLRAREIL